MPGHAAGGKYEGGLFVLSQRNWLVPTFESERAGRDLHAQAEPP
jgi:hypothetical protein